MLLDETKDGIYEGEKGVAEITAKLGPIDAGAPGQVKRGTCRSRCMWSPLVALDRLRRLVEEPDPVEDAAPEEVLR